VGTRQDRKGTMGDDKKNSLELEICHANEERLISKEKNILNTSKFYFRFKKSD